MSSPHDFVGMMRVTASPLTEETVVRYLCSVATALEERAAFCPHDGTRRKLWEPLVVVDGMEAREQTGHKWCTGCCNVLYNRLLAEMNVPDKYRA